jgi:hypothetical protein
VRPDYRSLRQQTGFSWQVSSCYLAVIEITDTPIRPFNLDPGACAEAYRRGRPMLRELFGEEMALPAVATPPVSYGHVNGLGSELIFPEGGEVGHTHPHASLEAGLEALRETVDFAQAGMAPFFLRFHEALKQAFPDEPVGFGYGAEGPLTTAYELRGEGFFYDLMDRPALCEQYLARVVDSIHRFRRFHCGVTDLPAFNPSGAGMVDDLASVVPPHLFARMVLPFWEMHFNHMTDGRRSAHVENLRPAQLPFLEEIGLSHFDPSISPQLDPPTIHSRCRVPFGWRLGCFHYRDLSCQDVEDFVFQAAADGASSVFTIVSNTMCNEPTVRKVRAFARAARQVEAMLAGGAGREEVRTCVSAAGRQRFWEHWPE